MGQENVVRMVSSFRNVSKELWDTCAIEGMLEQQALVKANGREGKKKLTGKLTDYSCSVPWFSLEENN